MKKQCSSPLRDIIVKETSLQVWQSYFHNWPAILCVDMTIKSLPALKRLEDKIERLSRTCFYKIQVCKLNLEKLQG